MKKLNLSLLTTALIACGYSSVATASNQFTMKANINSNSQTQQVEQSYYEDGEDFDDVSSEQSQGWGWNNGVNSNANIAAITECTTDCTTTASECTSSCTESSSSETFTLTATPAADDISPFHTTVDSHISWAVVRGYNNRVIG